MSGQGCCMYWTILTTCVGEHPPVYTVNKLHANVCEGIEATDDAFKELYDINVDKSRQKMVWGGYLEYTLAA
jgi:hypothetical protein